MIKPEYEPGDILGIRAYYLDPYKFQCRDGFVRALILSVSGFSPTVSYLTLVCDKRGGKCRLTVEDPTNLNAYATWVGHIDISELFGDDDPSGFKSMNVLATLQTENKKLKEENEELRKERDAQKDAMVKAIDKLYEHGFRYSAIGDILGLEDGVVASEKIKGLNRSAD